MDQAFDRIRPAPGQVEFGRKVEPKVSLDERRAESRLNVTRYTATQLNSCRFGEHLCLSQPCKPPFERGDGVLEIVAASCEHPREDRISDRGTVGYPDAFLFGGDIAIQKVNGAIEIADHLPDLRRIPLRGFACIKMTLVFHGMLQSKPFWRDQRGPRTV